MTFNKRKAGCTAFRASPHKHIESATWYSYETTGETTPVGKNKSKLNIKKTVITDPAVIQVCRDMAKAIASIYIRDTKTLTCYIWIDGMKKWQAFRSLDDAETILIREIRDNPPEGFNPADGDEAIPQDFISDTMRRADLFGIHGGEGFLPFGEVMYEDAGFVRRNTFRDDGVKPDLSGPLTPDETHILEQFLGGVIRINLCNMRGHKTLPELLHIIHDRQNDSEFLFRYVMHNIAVNYMRPGFNIQTNLAFCGEPGGVGKGYLEDVMGDMLGSQAGSPKDPLSRFNDWLLGKTFIVLNEVEGQFDNKKFNNMIKKRTIETRVPVEEKGIPEYTIPNMANYWLMSNSLFPYEMDSTDRRTIFIRTFNDPDGEIQDARVRFMGDFAARFPRQNVARALAKLCHMIDLDFEVLRYRQTDLARFILRAGAHPFIKFMRSANLTTCIGHDTSKNKFYLRVRDLKEQYSQWRDAHGHSRSTMNLDNEFEKHTQLFQKRHDRFFVNMPNLLAEREGCPYDQDRDVWLTHGEQPNRETLIHTEAPEPQQPQSRLSSYRVQPTPTPQPDPTPAPTQTMDDMIPSDAPPAASVECASVGAVNAETDNFKKSAEYQAALNRVKSNLKQRRDAHGSRH